MGRRGGIKSGGAVLKPPDARQRYQCSSICLVHMQAAVGDIQDRGDCERLVRAFYGRALVDPIIGWIFVDVAKLDLEAHVPRIASFWETVLLDGRSYMGGAFRPHLALHARVRLRAGHFERWLWLWRTTVDDLFAGERAELAKSHAQRVAHAFHSRLEAQDATGSSLPLREDLPDAEAIVIVRGQR